MSVLPFTPRQDADGEGTEIVEIDNPLAISQNTEKVGEWAGRKVFRPKFWVGLGALGAILLAAAYPAALLSSHKIGDDLSYPENLKQLWSSPWVGASAMLLDRELNTYGWSVDAPAWSPASRLTAMPAYQSALVAGIGEYAGLISLQVGASGENGVAPDPDLATVARLLEGAVSRDEIHAAHEALISYDGRVRLHQVDTTVLPSLFVERLALLSTWAERSAEELAFVSNTAGGSPFDDEAVVAVYHARARAYLAHRLISATDHPYGADASQARAAALNAWARAAAFEPLFVLNGAPDGMLISSHTASMNFLLLQARDATQTYMRHTASEKAAPVRDFSSMDTPTL